MTFQRSQRLIPVELINAGLNLENLGDLLDLEQTGYLSDLVYSGFLPKEWVEVFEMTPALSYPTQEIIREFNQYKALNYNYHIPQHLDSPNWQALRTRLSTSTSLTVLELSWLICPFSPLDNVRKLIKKHLIQAILEDDLAISTYPNGVYSKANFQQSSLENQLTTTIYLGSFSNATQYSERLKDYGFASLIWRWYFNQASISNTPDGLPIPWLFKDYKSTPNILGQALEAAYRLHREKHRANPTKPQDLLKFFNPKDLKDFIIWRNNQTTDTHVRLKLIDNRLYDYDKFRQLFYYWITI